MKKLMNLLLLVALLAMPVVLTSCGDEEDEPKGNVDVSLLMGDTWTFQKAILTVMGQKVEMSYNEILSYMSEEMGTSNLIVVDQKLKFTEDEMILVNTGDHIRYRLSSNGKFWFDGLDDIDDDDISLNISISELTSHRLVFRYLIGVEGVTITEDLIYTR